MMFMNLYEVEQKVFKWRQPILYKIPVSDFQDLVLKCHENKKDVESTQFSNRTIRARKSSNVNAISSAEAERDVSTMNNMILRWIIYELRLQATEWLYQCNGVIVRRIDVASASNHCSLRGL